MTSPSAPVALRSIRGAMVAVWVAAALAAAWIAAAVRWHETFLHDMVLGIGVFFLPPTVFFGAMQVIRWRLQPLRRPAAFEIDGGAFVAPVATKAQAVNAATALAVATALVCTYGWQEPGNYFDLVASRVGIPLMAVLFLVRVARLARRAGRIELRPEGLRVTSLFGVRELPWETVEAARYGQPTHTPGDTWVRPEFLAGAVNQYLSNPAARQAIGTAEGYEQLRAR
ncbi:hypothetical protein AB0J72_05630 [Dactylosporangium sp. NPDC049742]|uniref:hypothetical protein n=1 Tax=Dactylosporangium sp. NPDC049742 TaxID=3154737 RepID=UPI003428C526